MVSQVNKMNYPEVNFYQHKQFSTMWEKNKCSLYRAYTEMIEMNIYYF